MDRFHYNIARHCRRLIFVPAAAMVTIIIFLSSGIAAGAKVINYSTADGMSHDKAQGFFQDSSGMIWICTWYGIDRFDGYKFDSFRPPQSLNAESRFKEMLSLNDTLFIRTINGNVLSFDLANLKFDLFTDSIPKQARRLRRSFTDRKGNLWSSTLSGISLSINTKSSYFIMSNEYYPYPRCLFEDSDGRIWITWCSIADHNKGEVGIYDSYGSLIEMPLKGVAVYSIMEDKKRNIWLGTRNNGLIVLSRDDKGGYHRFDYHSSSAAGHLSHNAVFDIMQDTDGRVWIATLGGGLNVVESGYDIGNLTFLVPDGYPLQKHPRVRSLLQHKDRIFIGTDTGILQFQSNNKVNSLNFISVSSDGTMPAEEIIHLTEWTEEAFLVSSFGKGIYGYRYRTGTFFPVVAENFAEKQPVYAAQPIDDENLWVTTHTGILLYDLSKVNAFITPVDTQLTMLETKPLLDRKGQVWFGSANGVIRVNKPSEQYACDRNQIVFSGVTYFLGDTTVVELLTHKDHIIDINPAMRDLSLSVSSLDFGRLDGVKYYWRIKEQDTLWYEMDEGNHITLTNLTPGLKTVEVRSTDSYGRPIDNVSSICLNVKPRWHEHAIVRIIIGSLTLILLIFLLYITVKYRRLHSLYETILSNKTIAKVSAAMTDLKPEESLTEADEEFIRNLNSKIDTMMGDPKFSIDLIVSSIGMSRSVFYRRLKSVVGQSPSEYINKYRLRCAASMLRDHPGKSVASVAYDCGFSSPQYFSNLFRKEYQMTPNEWRKNCPLNGNYTE